MKRHQAGILALALAGMPSAAHAEEGTGSFKDAYPHTAVYVEVGGPLLTGLTLDLEWRPERWAMVRAGLGATECWSGGYFDPSYLCVGGVLGADVLAPLGRYGAVYGGVGVGLAANTLFPLSPELGYRWAIPKRLHVRLGLSVIQGYLGIVVLTPWPDIGLGYAF